MRDIDYQTFDYKNELRIDEFNLDIEWAMQPLLFMKYAEACAKTKLDMDSAKFEVDIVRADLDLAIRKDPEIYTGSSKKPTETQIANTIIIETQYKDAVTKYNQSRHDYDIMLSATRSFDQRKATLENLVRLHGQQYFSSPQEDTVQGDVVPGMRSDRVQDKVKSSLKRNKSKQEN